MKKRKAWNRGLIAAALLILGLILYQAADHARFKSSVPEISARIQEYESRSSEALKNSGSKNDSASFLNLAEQYWAEPETVSQAMRYSDTLSSFYRALEDEYVFLPLACKEELQSCRIRKNGPGSCIAELVINSTLWLDQYGSYLAPFGVGYAFNETAEDYTEETAVPETVKNGSQAIKLDCQQSVTLQLSETSGNWKINYSQMYAMSSSSSLVSRQEVPV